MFAFRYRFAQALLPALMCTGLGVGVEHAWTAERDQGADDAAMPMVLAEAEHPDMPAGGSSDGDASEARHGGGMHFRHFGMRPAMWAAARRLHLAGRLAALRVYLDITPQQEDAFRAFSQAVLAMVPDPQDLPDEHHPLGAFDGLDYLAKALQRRAAAAAALDQAAQALKGSLTPVQVAKADAAWAIAEEHWLQMRRRHEPDRERDREHEHEHGTDDRR